MFGHVIDKFFPSFLENGSKIIEESVKGGVIELWRAGKSYCHIGSALGISKTCVEHLGAEVQSMWNRRDRTQQSKTDEKVMVPQVIDSIAAMRYAGFKGSC